MTTTFIVAGLCAWSIAVIFVLAFIRGANPPKQGRIEQLEVQS